MNVATPVDEHGRSAGAWGRARWVAVATAIEAVVVGHVGPGMARVLESMRTPVWPATPGDAQASVLAAVPQG